MLKKLVSSIKYRLGRKARLKAEYDARVHRERNAEHQKQLGIRAANALRAAAGKNPWHVTVHREYKDIGAMWVRELPNSGIGYMVAAYVPDKKGFYGSESYMPCQFSVDVARDRIHALWSPTGPEEEHPLDQFEWLLQKACRHVQGWKLFPDDKIMKVA